MAGYNSVKMRLVATGAPAAGSALFFPHQGHAKIPDSGRQGLCFRDAVMASLVRVR
jgi:hypothetical protein